MENLARPEVVLRRLTAADLPFAASLNAHIGWNQTQRDWQGYLEFEPQGCFLAEIAGRPVGTATTVRFEETVAWIGMVLVHPDYRRWGIGTTLLKRALSYLREAGIGSIKLDATPLGRKVYVPLGFQDEYGVTRYDGRAPEGLSSGGVQPIRPEDWPALAALDRSAFGVERRRVLRSLASRQPELCLTAWSGGEMTGYLMAREGREALQLGSCVARDFGVARDLVHALLARVAGRRIFLDVPDLNQEMTAELRRLGFGVQRGFTRMFLGANDHPGDPSQIFATAGAEKG